jgi:tripartite-type tricarboxylate transporter receptor subunit TctC
MVTYVLKSVAWLTAALVLVWLFPGAAWAASKSAEQAFPGGKGVRMIIPYPPGGGNDAFGRFLVHGLNEGFAPGSIADNRGGAGTVIGTEIAAKGNPDGHTLLIVSVPFIVLNALYPDLKIDAVSDFAPVILAGSAPSIMLANAVTPYKSVKELVSAARAKPGEIAYASSGNGGSTHLMMELFKSLTKTSLIHIPYKGGGPAVTALIGGEVSVHFSNPQTSGAFIKAGRVRGLAVTSRARLKAFPDIPTMAEAGVPGCEGGPFWGVAAPAKTPRPVIAKLNTEFNRILATTELRRHFANEDVEVAGGSPDQFGAFLRREVALWGKVIREAKIKAE